MTCTFGDVTEVEAAIHEIVIDDVYFDTWKNHP
jgi:hypothetical protein